MLAATALFLLCAGVWAQEQPSAQATTNAASEHAVRQLIDSLAPKSMWRNLLEHGARGDGVRRPWMDDMQKEDVKLAVFNFEFHWTDGGRELKDWTLVGERYYRDYDFSQPKTEPRHRGDTKTDGLAQELKAAALTKAKAGHWFEWPEEKTGTGYDEIYLADNEWLPVELSFPFYGHYEPGTTPLMHAALLGDVALIQKLLTEGADVNGASTNGSTALIYATESGALEAIQSLLAAGADPSKATNDGSTALMTASAGGDLRSVVLLLKAGADPNSQDAHGYTALSIAKQRNHFEIVSLLKQSGARQ